MNISTDTKYLGHEFTTWQSLYALIAGWNVSTVRGAIDAHDTGSSFVLSGGLAVVASRYPWIFAALRQRKAPPLGLSREVYGGDSGSALRAKQGFSRVARAIERLHGDIFDGHAQLGFQVLQHVWRPSADASTIEPTTKLWPSSCVWLNPRSGGLESITTEGRIPIIDGDGHWTIIGAGQRPFLNGAVRAYGENWAGARYAQRDEEALSAYLGRLCPIGILPAAILPNTPEGDAFDAAVKDLGEAQSGAVFPTGSQITTLPNVDAGAAQLFAGLLERRGRACAMVILGTDGTISKGSPGVYTSPLFGEVAFAVVREDTAHAGAGISRLGAVYGAVNYGLSEEESPGYRWLLPDPTEADRRKALAEADLALAATLTAWKAAGIEITPERANALAKRYGADPVALAAGGKRPEIFAYHIEQKVVAPDQVLASLDLPVLPGGVGSPEHLAKLRLEEEEVARRKAAAEAAPPATPAGAQPAADPKAAVQPATA